MATNNNWRVIYLNSLVNITIIDAYTAKEITFTTWLRCFKLFLSMLNVQFLCLTMLGYNGTLLLINCSSTFFFLALVLRQYFIVLFAPKLITNNNNNKYIFILICVCMDIGIYMKWDFVGNEILKNPLYLLWFHARIYLGYIYINRRISRISLIMARFLTYWLNKPKRCRCLSFNCLFV